MESLHYDRTGTATYQLVIQAAESDMGVQENEAILTPKTGAKMQAHRRRKEYMVQKRQKDCLGRLNYRSKISMS